MRLKKFNPQKLIHARVLLDVPLPGGSGEIRLRGRIVSAGFRAPGIVYKGDKTPVAFVGISFEGAEDYESTSPQTYNVDLESPVGQKIQFLGGVA